MFLDQCSVSFTSTYRYYICFIGTPSVLTASCITVPFHLFAAAVGSVKGVGCPYDVGKQRLINAYYRHGFVVTNDAACRVCRATHTRVQYGYKFGRNGRAGLVINKHFATLFIVLNPSLFRAPFPVEIRLIRILM